MEWGRAREGEERGQILGCKVKKINEGGKKENQKKRRIQYPIVVFTPKETKTDLENIPLPSYQSN